MQYLKVKNLARYQHYGNRNPPWIKLYRVIMGDYTLRQVPVVSRLAFIYFMVLASETDNRVPFDCKYLTDRMGFTVSEAIVSPLLVSGLLLASGARRVLAIEEKRSSLSPLLLTSSLKTPNQDLKSTKHSKMSGAHPIPDEWTPKETHQKLASARGLDLPIEAAHFRGKADELGWVTTKWDQKFTNWMLQEIKFRARRAT